MLHLYNFLIHCKSCLIRTCYSQFRKKTRVLVFQRVWARVQGRRCGGGMARWSFEKIVFFLNLTFLLFPLPQPDRAMLLFPLLVCAALHPRKQETLAPPHPRIFPHAGASQKREGHCPRPGISIFWF